MQSRKICLRRYVVLVWVCAGILTGCSSPKNLMEGQTDSELFEQGMSYYKQADYAKALPYLLYVKEHFIRSSHAGLTRFYAGECYFAEEKYEEAAGEYQSFLTFFQNEPNAPAAQYQLGVSYLKQSLGPDRDQKILQKALTELQKVKAKYPTQEEYVNKAETQIRATKHELALHELQVATFYWKTKHYLSSNRRLDYLLKEYPESDLAGDALFYQGLNYVELKQPEHAKNAFLQFLQKYPAHRAVTSAQKELEKLGAPTTPQTTRPPTAEKETSNVLSEKKASEPAKAKRLPIQGYIVTLRDNLVVTNLIRDDGIQEGMVLEIHRNDKLIGMIRITEIRDGFSTAQIESLGAGLTIQVEDQVCCPKTEK